MYFSDFRTILNRKFHYDFWKYINFIQKLPGFSQITIEKLNPNLQILHSSNTSTNNEIILTDHHHNTGPIADDDIYFDYYGKRIKSTLSELLPIKCVTVLHT